MKVAFQNKKGKRLIGILNKINENDIIIIGLHGFRSSKDPKTYVKMQELLEKENINFFRFDLSAHGESEGETIDMLVSDFVDDVKSSIEFLRNKGYNRFGLFGSSIASIPLLYNAKENNSIKFVALRSPSSDYYSQQLRKFSKEEIKIWKDRDYIIKESYRPFKISYRLLKESKNYSLYDIAQYIKCPVLIIHGSEDKVVLPEDPVKLSKLLPKCRLQLIEGQDHTFTTYNQKELKRIANWIKEQVDKL